MFFNKSIWSFCDLTESFTRLVQLRVRQSPYSVIDVLGAYEYPTQGIISGEIVHLGDVSESIYAATKEVENQSGRPIESLTLSLNDLNLESVKVRGGAFLNPAGESFDTQHIEEAKQKALQTLDPQDKHIVYKKEAGFLVDRQDYIQNPIGICGKELTVILHLLFSESKQVQVIQQIMDRVSLKVDAIYPSGLAAMYGVLEKEKLQARGALILVNQFDITWVLYEHEAIQEYRSIALKEEDAETLTKFFKPLSSITNIPIVATGEKVENLEWQKKINDMFRQEVSFLSPLLINAQSRFSVVNGLCTLKHMNSNQKLLTAPFAQGYDYFQNKCRKFIDEYF